MCGNEIALSGCVHVSRFVSEVKSIVTRPPCFSSYFGTRIFLSQIFKCPVISEFYVEVSRVCPVLRVVEAMQVELTLFIVIIMMYLPLVLTPMKVKKLK